MAVYNANARIDTIGPRMKIINAESVDLQRTGELTISDVVASLGTTTGEEVIPGVAITQVRYQDFFFDVDDYGSGWAETKPQIADLVVWGSEKYRVISLGNNTPPFEYTTSTKKRIRVHTDQIA